jgi:hypothetical protein
MNERPADPRGDSGGAWTGPRSAVNYARALMKLLDEGRLGLAGELARRLRREYPNSPYAEVMDEFFARLPPPGSQPAFVDDLTQEVQVVRRDGADAVLFLFCGFDHRLGLSLTAMHRWFGRLPASLVYLRDFRSLFYLGGLATLGADSAATAAGLRDIAAGLGGRRILCCGCSGGVYAALSYGLALGAEAVLALAGPTNLATDFNAHLRSARRVAHLWSRLPQAPAIDLRRAYAEAARPPRVLFVFDRNNWDDRLHAEHLAGLPTVRLDPLEDRGIHAVIMLLIVNGLLDAKLDWLTGGEPASAPG